MFIIYNLHVLTSVLALIIFVWFSSHLPWLPYANMKQFQSDKSDNILNIQQFKKDWCQIRRQRTNWSDIQRSCIHKSPHMNDPRYATNPSRTKISHVLSRPAGEHTRIRIDSYTTNGAQKSFGGDSFRVRFIGPDILSVTVFDLHNGSYDAVGLVVTPGEYKIEAILDYTQCNGFNDPPTDWYVKAHCSSKSRNTSIPSYVSSLSLDYINYDVSNNTWINITNPTLKWEDLATLIANTSCGSSCSLLWDGNGVWSKHNDWKEYIKGSFGRMNKKDDRLKHGPRGLLSVYGDSISYYFFERLKKKGLCGEIFHECRNTYTWIYPKKLYEMRNFCDDIDVHVGKVRKYFREVIKDGRMDNSSVLIFNLGAHFVKNTSFKKYQEVIRALIEELQDYEGMTIWKSTTAIHDQYVEVMGAFRRYLTAERVGLFNAYANDMMCHAGYNLLDIHPITSSYPQGTKDGVHYHRNASTPIESMLLRYFSG